MNDNDTGLRVKQRRKALRLTMDDLAEKVGYSSPTKKTIIYQVESGKNELKLSRLLSFASALQTNVYYLLGLTDVENLTDEEILRLIHDRSPAPSDDHDSGKC